MGKGYMGKILRVDLGTREIREGALPEAFYERHLAGQGLAARLLSEEIPAGADPLGPGNVLAFAAGILTGTGSLFAGRWTVAGKSPLTGGWGDANAGGTFAPAIKRCGYDAILFRGASEAPVYLYVRNGSAELRDAADLWGRDTTDAEEALAARHGPGARVAAIGPAGEKRSLLAGISNDRGRIAARSGLGAVMGSKQLKAVVLDGNLRIPVHDRSEIKRLSEGCNRWVRLQPPFLPGPAAAYVGSLMRMLPMQMAQDGLLYKILLKKWGTVSMNQMSVEMGDAPVRNWLGSSADWPPAKSLSVNPDAVIAREQRKYHCYSCPLGCGGICRTARSAETHKPEYETVLALGALCMNGDLDSICDLNERLNRAGMDTISAGGTVAFAIECYENGLLTKADTDGLDLTWGNTAAVVALVGKMISREGIGDLLADGTRAAAARIGKGAEQFAVHAGGQELPMHDGRNDPGYALHYAAEPTPGRHTLGSQMYYEMFQLWRKAKDLPSPAPLYFKGRKYDPSPEKAVMAAACTRYMNVANGAGLCLFGLFLGAHRIPVFDWLNAATGWQRSPEEYLALGGEIQTIKQRFNIAHGIDPASVSLPGRALGRPPQQEGANRGRTVEIEEMRGGYWREFGWDPQTGRPPETGKAESGSSSAM